MQNQNLKKQYVRQYKFDVGPRRREYIHLLLIFEEIMSFVYIWDLLVPQDRRYDLL